VYAGDSFYSLSLAGQGGLLVLSLSLALASVACVLALFRLSKSFGLRMIAACAVFWAFLWLSPQIYYFYYQIILDDLPWQIVVGGPPSPVSVIELLSFSGPATLADHAKGAFGWTLFVLVLLAAAKVLRLSRLARAGAESTASAGTNNGLAHDQLIRSRDGDPE
jgi:hypothetical protein